MIHDLQGNPDLLEDGRGRATDPNAPAYGDAEDGGALLTMSEEKAARRIERMVEAQEQTMSPRKVQWKVNALRRRGVPNVKVQARSDGSWFVWKAPNVNSPDSVLQVNKAADLCRKLVSFVFADPPAPEAAPHSGSDEDKDSAEVATQILLDLQGETGLNDVGKARRALDRACSYSSGFVRYWPDPRGGGRVPIELEAGFDPRSGREAASVDEAEDDPLSGVGWPDYRRRYVRADGTLTSEKSEAASRWTTALKSEVLTGQNVRFIPHTAEDIWDARGAIILSYTTWGDVKAMFPEWTEKLKEEDVEAILGYRPKQPEDILAPGVPKRALELTDDKEERLVYTATLYMSECPDYPKGAYIVTVAGKFCPVREGWSAEIDGQRQGLMLPLTQYRMFDEGRDDPYSVALMEIVGPGNELRGAVWAGLLDHLDRVNNRKTFLPTTSPIHPKQLNRGGYSILPMTPGGEPKFEDVPEFSPHNFQALERVGADMDSASGLQQTGQGLEARNVDSGRHAYAVLSQVHANLSELAQNIERAYVRGCRIQLQLVAAFYTMEQQVSWKGRDGEFKIRNWRGSDFKSTRDVRLKPGTLTMLSPSAKEQQAMGYGQAGMIPPHELREIIRSNVGSTLGMSDDPHLQRVRRQLEAWKDGPPEGWAPPEAPMLPDPLTGGEAPELDPMTGLPAPPPPDPLLATMWEPSPADTLPDVAPMRLAEIARLASSRMFFEKPIVWRAALEAEFVRMQQTVYPPAMPAPDPAAQPAGAEVGGPPAAEQILPEQMPAGVASMNDEQTEQVRRDMSALM